MSFDAHAIVPASRWPTFAQLNAAMAARGYPASLEGFDSADEPVRPVPSVDLRYGLTDEQISAFGALETGALVRMNEELVEPDLNYWIIDPVIQDGLRPAFEQFHLPAKILHAGDLLVTHCGHSLASTWNAGLYLIGSLILDFGGYGFELQGGAHGREAFAAELFDSLEIA
jgi:hypothetical protein